MYRGGRRRIVNNVLSLPLEACIWRSLIFLLVRYGSVICGGNQNAEGKGRGVNGWMAFNFEM